jgi:hypothetical protein
VFGLQNSIKNARKWNTELAMPEDLEMHLHEAADTIVLVVKMAAERWRNRHESEFRVCVWNTQVIGNMRENEEGMGHQSF